MYLDQATSKASAANVGRSTDEGRLRYGRGLFQKL
jgi:hypothetical protein